MSPATPARWSRGHPLRSCSTSPPRLTFLPSLALPLPSSSRPGSRRLSLFPDLSLFLSRGVPSSFNLHFPAFCLSPSLSVCAVLLSSFSSFFSFQTDAYELCAFRRDYSFRIRNYPLVNRFSFFILSLFLSLRVLLLLISTFARDNPAQ